MDEPIVGSEKALICRILWDLRHGYTRQQSLEKWHKWSPDISDDVFDALYAKAQQQYVSIQYWNQTAGMMTIKECQEWTKHR